MAETITEGFSQIRLELHDTIVLKANPSLTGFVLRTYHDLNSHEPVEDNLIISHVPVPKEVLEQFLRSGAPPKGYVFVQMAHEECGSSLVSEADVILVSRSLTLGDTVKLLSEDSMVGTVTSVHDLYTLEPICRVMKHKSPPTVTFSDVDDTFSSCTDVCNPRLAKCLSHRREHDLLYQIPEHELKRAQDFLEGDHVFMHDWVGEVDTVDSEVILLLDDLSVVVVQESLELELVVPNFDAPLVSLPEPGDFRRPNLIAAHHDGISSIPFDLLSRGKFVITNRRNLREGRWLAGAYNPNLEPRGWVLDVRAHRLDVRWQTREPFASPNLIPIFPSGRVRPYENIRTFQTVRELRRNKNLTLLDVGLPPRRSESGNGGSVILTGQDFKVGDQVRFRDQVGASVKYAGIFDQTHGVFNRIPRESTWDFDMNEFRIVCAEEEVTVMWQDQSVTRQNSFLLRPFALPEADLCPGDVVTAREGMKQVLDAPDSVPIDFNEMSFFEKDYVLIPEKVGVIQSVDSRERLARVRWFTKPHIRLLAFGQVLEPSSVFGELGQAVDDVSLYEIMSHPALLRQRGSLVVLQPSGTRKDVKYKDESQQSGQAGSRTSFAVPDTHVYDWIGEIVDLGLDGLATVRLSAAKPCCDVRIPYDKIHQTLNWDQEFGDSNASQPSDLMSVDVYISEDEQMDLDSPVEESIDYEGGERLDDDSEDEQWLTEEDEDEPTNRPLTALELRSRANAENETNATETKQSNVEDSDTFEPDLQLNSLHANPEASNLSLAESIKHLQGPNLPANSLKQESSQRVGLPATTVKGVEYSSLEKLFAFDGCELPPAFVVLEQLPPGDQFGQAETPATSPAILKRVIREHRTLQTSLVAGEIYVRTYESRLDLLRCLIVGPADTPYEYAPLLVDLHLGPRFPAEPPTAHFHSWTSGMGRINPNLYEEGKICLSLLGTWPGQNQNEGWSPSSTILQILVSLQGLVLVKDPFYNEAGFEAFSEDKAYVIESQQYNEKTYIMARRFVKHAITDPVRGLEDVLAWLYLPANPKVEKEPAEEGGYRDLLRKVTNRAQALIARSLQERGRDILLDGEGHTEDVTKAFLKPLSQGAVVMLRRDIATFEEMLRHLERSRTKDGGPMAGSGES